MDGPSFHNILVLCCKIASETLYAGKLSCSVFGMVAYSQIQVSTKQ